MFSVAKIFAIKKFSVIFLIAFGAILNHASFAAGEVDTSFNPWAQFRANGDVHCSLTQPDGKILVGGSFTAVNGYAAHLIARLNVDGSVDTSFNPPQFSNAAFEVRILTIAVQSNGKILVGGSIESADGQFSLGVKRLNPNGSLDTTFQSSNLLSSSEINVIKVQPDDKFLMGGIFSHVSGRNNLVRYNADGSFDESFTFPVSVTRMNDVEFLPDGKMLVVGELNINGILLRINPNGATDNSFVVAAINNGSVRKVKTHPNGKIMIAGGFATVNGIQKGGAARFNSDGTHDPTFNQGGTGADSVIWELKIKPDGKILLGGSFNSFNGNARWRIAQLNEDGTHDFLFYPGLTFIGSANALEVLPDGKILVGLGYTGLTGGLARINADGAVDNSISYYVHKVGFIRKIVTQPDGKILVCGEFDAANNTSRPGVARFNPDGTLDTTFNPTFSPQKIHALALQADGKILIGMHGGLVLKRLNADGSIDSSFVTGGVAGEVYDIVVLPNTQILIGGLFMYNNIVDRFVVRVSQNGAMDLSFANPPFIGAPVLKVFVQPTGKIVVGGGALRVNNGIIRLNTNGTMDATFTASTPSTIIDIDSQSDGKLVVVGNFGTLNGSSAGRNIGRLTADGALDTSFTQTTDGQLEGVKVQSDGKILVSGSMTNLGGGAVNRKGLARFNANGSIDTSFIANTNGIARDVVQQTDGKILAGGQFTRINGISKVSIARLSNAPRNSFDFDGDGKADVAVFRPSENKWYVLRSSDLGVTQQVFAVAGDVPVPADYDGDGKTDFAIFRPSTGDWWYLSSLNAAQVSAHWGAAGDIPRPSDFDGDGRADYIVFRPSDNFWYRASSANGATSNAAFGLAGDKPVTGDFDGDGKSDKAIFRASTGDWWWQSSIDNAQRATHWGADTDIPAPADYDGDGKTDFAVYRPSTGAWYVVNSGNGSFTILSFGIAEDKPVPADYDGDGKADIAVFRPSNGAWYLLRSTDGFFALSFGVSSDVPTPNAFVP